MAEDKNSQTNATQPRAEFKVPTRTYLLWIAILGIIPLLMIFRNNAKESGALGQYEFMQMLENDLIATALITLDTQSPYLREVRGRYWRKDAQGRPVVENGERVQVPFHAQVFLSEQQLQDLLSKPNFRAKRPNMVVVNLVWSLGPILLVALLIYFFLIRQMKSAAKMARGAGARMPDDNAGSLRGIIEPRTAVFAGTTVPLDSLVDALKAGQSIDEFLARFPSVKREQVIAVIEAGKLKVLEAADRSS
jgi:hypothetical protein